MHYQSRLLPTDDGGQFLLAICHGEHKIGGEDTRETQHARFRVGSAGGELEQTTVNGRRHFLGGSVTPPTPHWTAGVAITFADDTIDLWPLKPCAEPAFTHEWYPLAAIAPQTRGKAVVQAVERMAQVFKPRKTG
jgi:hypothetical protein